MAGDAARRVLPLWSYDAPAEPHPEITLYVKGFLPPGEAHDDFQEWSASHARAVSQGAVGPGRAGWIWQPTSMLGVPLPVLSVGKAAWDVYRHVRFARALSILPNLGLAAAELVAQFVSQYLTAAWAAEEGASALAEELRRLRSRHERIRLVGHSLGCRLILDALELLDDADRPEEVHLLAPACCEEDVRSALGRLGTERSRLYYAGNDLVLVLGFRLLALREALGAIGPVADHPGLEAVDVTDRLRGWRVHGAYKQQWDELLLE